MRSCSGAFYRNITRCYRDSIGAATAVRSLAGILNDVEIPDLVVAGEDQPLAIDCRIVHDGGKGTIVGDLLRLATRGGHTVDVLVIADEVNNLAVGRPGRVRVLARAARELAALSTG